MRDKTRERARDEEWESNRRAHEAKIAARDENTRRLRALRLARDTQARGDR
jgi:hypothetical protein